ncbi:MAG: carboxylating nicotinate-nucleotide diphosphorylase [Acidobacteria bacterium]|nr:carboxylating nicotinate-nucleotide diphosphorylase [Acidobacteriota bacterium]
MKHNSERITPLHPILYEEIVHTALMEDLGRIGDITTEAVVFAEDTATARIVSHAPGRIAGIDIAGYTFNRLDARLLFEVRTHDGMDVESGDTIAVIRGGAGSILSGERTALNFLSHLSGIATATREIVEMVAPYPARVVCTRKTTPGLRALEKYAVRAGGGFNHRFGLNDAILIKDNHIIVAGNIAEAVHRVRRKAGHMVKVEVEVDSLQQLETALKEKIDAVLLDNMDPDMLSEAVRMVNGKVTTEASGGVTPQTACAVAASGVDILSLGWLTHSAPALNLSLDISVEK